MILRDKVLFILIVSILITNSVHVLTPLHINNGSIDDSTIKYKNYEDQELLRISSTQDWVKTWGKENWDETNKEMDVYNKTGDVYLIGRSYNDTPIPNSKIVLVKYNKSGEQEWNRTIIGNEVGYENEGNDIVVDQSSGEIYIVGTIKTAIKNAEIFIAKYFKNGTQDWNITWGYSSNDSGKGLALDNKGNLYVTGCTEVGLDINIVLIKFEIALQTQAWNVTWGLGSTVDYAFDVACGLDGDIYITGAIYNGSFHNMVLIKYTEDKVNEWNQTWSKIDYNIYGYSVAIDSKNDIYVTGSRHAEGSGYTDEDDKMFLRKYSNKSNLIWSRIYDNLTNGIGRDICIDLNDNAVVTLEFEDMDCDPKFICLGYNSSGYIISKIEWESVGDQISAESVSGYGTDHFYISGNIYDQDIEDTNFILVRNASIISISDDPGPNGDDNGNGEEDGIIADDGDDDDNGDANDKKSVIPGYNNFFIIGLIGIVSSLVIIRFKKK